MLISSGVGWKFRFFGRPHNPSNENRQFSILSAFSTRLKVENFTVLRVGRLAVQARPPQGQILTGHRLIP